MLIQTIILGFLALATTAKMEPTYNKDAATSLPWGIYWALPYEKDDKIYIFRNVRFGKKPERFSRSYYPDSDPLSNTVQSFTQNISCIQINSTRQKDPPGGRLRLGDPENSDELQIEDCLFLDIYAPVSAFESKETLLPVVVWFHGGAYALGSKNPLGPINTGQSILRASNYSVIFIIGNYRLGAFGWLAGNYMENAGQPNAGLYDQSLLLNWVQDYVDQVHGDKSQVSAWGMSAGAGSILHHLIREDGSQDPLFNTFAVQSPAFQWAWNNSADGELDKTYKNFSDFAGCGRKYNITCLRDAPLDNLTFANEKLFNESTLTGLFPVGPAVDGNWIKSIPTIRFSQGNFWKGIKSAIVSHCANEAHFFTPNITSQKEFDEFLHRFLPHPGLDSEIDAVREKYNCTANFGGDFFQCLSIVIRDSSFTCNTRNLFEAYPTASYMMQYTFTSIKTAFHAVDLLPLFMNNQQEVVDILESTRNISNGVAEIYAGYLDKHISKIYQSYFASLALSGDPNKFAASKSPLWLPADRSADQLSHVMSVRSPLFPLPSINFKNITDDQNSNSTCSFWTEIAKNITSAQTNINNEKIPLIDDPEEL
ncbi:carboxylesterase family protein [Biscogniauxia sp. FL1348]|nr:carboxylesterase family protein [Biscogniauxia sp. FL1348]